MTINNNVQTDNDIETYEKPELKECGTIKEDTNSVPSGTGSDGGTWSG